jgi:RNA polymerase sigma-70 factor (ECF subfamily)
LPDRNEQIAELYQRYRPIVYRRCLKLLGDPARAEDATHDVFVKLTQTLDSLRDPQAALAFVTQTATHHCLNLLRSEGRTEPLPQGHELPGASPSRRYRARAMGQKVLERLNTLTRAVALGVLGGGEERGEAAARLGVSRKTVTRKLQRIYAQARKLLGGAGDE